MRRLSNVLNSCRLVTFSVNHVLTSKTNIYLKEFQATPALNYINARVMAQKSITSFFKITPKKSQDLEDKINEKDEPVPKDEISSVESPSTNGNAKRSSKRLRSDSIENESPDSSKRSSSPDSTEKKKKSKRQRIESSESESETPTKITKSPEKNSNVESSLKLEKDSPKTYASPKSKKAKTQAKTEKEPKSEEIEKDTSPSPEIKIKKEMATPKEKKKATPKGGKRKAVKTEAKEDSSPEKENVHEETTKARSASPIKEEVKKDKSPPKKRNPFEPLKGKGAAAKENGVKKEAEDTDSGKGELVAEVDYDPGKRKYHPVKDACWAEGQPVPYLALAKTLEAVEATAARLRMVEILSNYLRSVIALTPEDLLPSVYLCLNRLAPAYHSLELGIAETYLMKAVGQCTGRSLAQVRSAAQRAGDLGLVAERARASQRTMFAPPPLAVRKVFQALKEIALMTGQASVNKKIGKIQSLYVACRHSEARYLIRSLEGKLRVGLAEQSLLQALALACAHTPPAGPLAGELDVASAMSADTFKARVEQFALTIKTTYCECPNYDEVVAVLLRHGVLALPDHCRLTPGVPLKPMLAHPTRGVHEVFNRFEKEPFTCEYKYDGERAQIHVPGDGAPDLAHAAVFSRNQENNTSKYPDILSRLPTLLKESVTSCVLDCEAVAYDPVSRQILPFQVLSTRKRKDAAAADVKVQVCVFVFDLLYLNGRALVREPLAERRRLLRDHFHQRDGTWQFAVSRDCATADDVQQFLDEAVRGSCEGLMVKALRGDGARYDIARRSHNWLKLKKDYLEGVGDTIDVVVIGGYRGKGKRAGCFGGFLLACYEPDGEQFQSLCKIGTGFSDDDLRTLGEALQEHVIEAPRNYYRYDSSHEPDTWFSAACVWEVRCADLSLSPAHRAALGLVDRHKGISLRFPRFIRVRPDKSPEQATSAQQIARLYLAQDQVRNQPGDAGHDDDFY